MAQNAGSGKGLFLGIAAVLGVIAIGLGIFAFMQTGALGDARLSISSLETKVDNLEADVNSLQGQLNTEKSNVASLNTQLTAEKKRASDLETELTSTKNTLATTQGDLTTAQGRITTLTNDLNASKARVTSLEADLATANGKVATLSADLTKATADLTKATADLTKATADLAKANSDLTAANSELTAAKASINTLTSDLNKLKAPRHFNSLEELTAWLAKDDTNINPKYASYDLMQKSYILQIKAARDGFIISTLVDTDGTRILVGNEAIAGSTLYVVSASLDIALPMIPNLPTPSIPLALE